MHMARHLRSSEEGDSGEWIPERWLVDKIQKRRKRTLVLSMTKNEMRLWGYCEWRCMND
jgi:hypothetical protein